MESNEGENYYDECFKVGEVYECIYEFYALRRVRGNGIGTVGIEICKQVQRI